LMTMNAAYSKIFGLICHWLFIGRGYVASSINIKRRY
jgi:hypothetical protein